MSTVCVHSVCVDRCPVSVSVFSVENVIFQGECFAINRLLRISGCTAFSSITYSSADIVYCIMVYCIFSYSHLPPGPRRRHRPPPSHQSARLVPEENVSGNVSGSVEGSVAGSVERSVAGSVEYCREC